MEPTFDRVNERRGSYYHPYSSKLIRMTGNHEPSTKNQLMSHILSHSLLRNFEKGGSHLLEIFRPRFYFEHRKQLFTKVNWLDY